MATQFSTLLKLALPTQGELSGSWGDVVNNNITSMIEEAVAGLKTINTWSSNSATLSTANGTTAESRAAILNLTDSTSDLTGAATLICPTLTKVFIVKNSTGEVVTVKTASGSGIAIANGNTSLLFCDGTNVVEAITGITGNLAVGGNLTVAGNATVTGTTTFNGGTLTLGDSAADNVVFGADVNSSIIPNTDSTFDLGSASQEWRDIYIDGTAHIDSINLNGTAITSTAAEINILDGVTSTAAELNILDGVTSTAAELNILDGVTSTAAELNALDGITAVVGELNALDIGSTAIGTAVASKAVILDANKDYTGIRNLTTTGNVVVGGDLTISGDDLTMATNTAGALLIADGTNFNPTAVGSLSEISTVANDDVFLAVDTSGGGLKKITRSAVVAGLATSSAISNLSEDSTPQLGGNLDLNGNDIVTVSNADLELAPNGTGHVTVRGNTNQGTIQFNCESNSHGQKIKAAPHSEAADNVLTLPSTGGDARLVSTASTATLTNKTLTSPKINEDVAVTSTATELNLLDGVTSTTAELNILDGVTSTAAELNALDGITAVVGELNALDLGSTAVGTAIASKAVILDSNKDYTGFRNITTTGVVTVGSQLIMPDVTSTKMLVADGTSYQEVSISGDVTIANTGAVTIAANAVEGSMLNTNVISGQTALTSGLASTDELLVSDGGTLKRMDVSVLTAVTDASAADSAVALAIALG